MDKNELEIINKAVQEKYKYHKLWIKLTFIFLFLAFLFALLYFTSGDVFKQTINENNNDVEIINNGDSNNNNVTINN